MVTVFYRTVISVLITTIAFFGGSNQINQNANKEKAVTTTTIPQEEKITAMNNVRAQDIRVQKEAALISEYKQQYKNPRVPTIQYWERVAVCESSRDGTTARWNDGGKFSGGLGIFTGTWVSFGGRQFAQSAGKATKMEQIVVANRIAVVGWQTKNKFASLDDKLANRPYFQKAVGFNGWGCIKHSIGSPKPRTIKKTKK